MRFLTAPTNDFSLPHHSSVPFDDLQDDTSKLNLYESMVKDEKAAEQRQKETPKQQTRQFVSCLKALEEVSECGRNKAARHSLRRRPSEGGWAERRPMHFWRISCASTERHPVHLQAAHLRRTACASTCFKPGRVEGRRLHLRSNCRSLASKRQPPTSDVIQF